MSFFRSETVLHKHIRLPGSISAAVKVLDKLGSFEADSIEFLDLTKDDYKASKTFTPMIERCENNLQIISFSSILFLYSST